MSFPNNYEVDQDGVVTEFDDPDLLSNRRESVSFCVCMCMRVFIYLYATAAQSGPVILVILGYPHWSSRGRGINDTCCRQRRHTFSTVRI